MHEKKSFFEWISILYKDSQLKAFNQLKSTALSAQKAIKNAQNVDKNMQCRFRRIQRA